MSAWPPTQWTCPTLRPLALFQPMHVPLPNIYSLNINYKLTFKLLILKYILKDTEIYFLICYYCEYYQRAFL